MSKWSKKFGKILTAAAISAFLAVSSLAVPIAASAARVNTDGVTIRNGASRDDGAIGSLDEGTEVTILETVENDEGETWYYIQLENGNTGYVFSSLIDASDEEIAAAGGAGGGEEQAQEEQPQEEPKEEPAEEPAQEPAQEQNPEPQPAAEDQQTQEASAAATEAPAAQGGEYDATKDPNAAFRVSYDTDESGNGEWYVHNDDNGSKWKVSDLQGQGGSSANAKADGVAPVWRTLAILFGLLVIALVAFVLFLLKSIRDGRSKTTRGRALEAAAAGRDDDEDEYEDDDEYYFEDDDDEEPAEEEEDLPDEEPSENNESSETDAASDSDTPSEADQAQQRSAGKAEEKPIVNTDSTITMDVSSETEVTEIPTEEIEAAIAATTAKIEKNISDQNSSDQERSVQETSDQKTSDQKTSIPETSDQKTSGPEEQAVPAPAQEEEVQEQESDYVDEELDDYETDSDEDPDADDYEDEDEDYVDEDDDGYEDEDYEEDEEDDTRGSNRRARSSSKGGFFGFLKKMFGSDSKEDAEDEGEDFDDYEDEPDEHEFDEYKEYPEDIDLLPKEETEEDEDSADNEEDIPDSNADPAAGGRGRLSMQRVMKNVSYKEEEADFSDDDDDLSDSLFDDDDDMEYSFISNTRNKK